VNVSDPTSWKRKLAFATVTLAVAGGVLELVAGAMKFPDPGTVAAREQVIAAQSERAAQIRALQNGEVQFATTAARPGI
jgi:hypothetical protein